jgi:hypothetical protein
MAMKETELAQHIIEFVERLGWEVYQEVQLHPNSKVADILATNNLGEVWIIETKTTFGLAVIEQAYYWSVHYRSIGIPALIGRGYQNRKKRSFGYKVATQFANLGILEVVERYSETVVNQFRVAPINPHVDNRLIKHIFETLTPLHKTYAQAGNPNGNRLTPYNQSMMSVKEFITNHPNCTVANIVDNLGKLHYASVASAKGSLLTALRDYEDWCVVNTTVRPFTFSIK